MNRASLFVAVVAIVILSTTSALADELHVPLEFPTLADAVAAAEPGDVIVLGEGVFEGGVVIESLDIAIRGAGIDRTVIKAKPTTPGYSEEILEWRSLHTGGNTQLETPLLSDLTLDAYAGGDRDDRYNYSVPLSIVGLGSGSVLIEHVKFYDHNNANSGGNFIGSLDSLIVRDCIFEDIANESGGLLIRSITSVGISGCRFIRCGGFGSPLELIEFQNAKVDNCLFQATYSLTERDELPTLRLYGSHALIKNCSFGATGPDWRYPKSKSRHLSLSNGQFLVQNCSFATGTPTRGGTHVVFTNCIGEDLPIGNNNVLADPGFVDPGSPGADGVWRTDDDYLGDLTPSHHSLMVDATTGAFTDIYSTDSLGNPRLIDVPLFDNAGTGPYPYLDIGAIELQDGISPCIADVNRDGTLTPTDFTAWINASNNNLPECDQNGDGNCSPTDFTAWIANYNAGC